MPYKTFSILTFILIFIATCANISYQNKSETATEPIAKTAKWAVGENNCHTCHQDLEPIREAGSEMMQAIWGVTDKVGFTGNDCFACHGGNPHTTDINQAQDGTIPYFLLHEGPKNFYPDPGSLG